MQIQVLAFFVEKEGCLYACASHTLGIEAEYITMLHQMTYMCEILNAMLNFGVPSAIHVFQLAYAQFAILYTLVASPADVAAVLGDVLYAKQVAECLSVKGDFNYGAIREHISKKPATQVLFIVVLDYL